MFSEDCVYVHGTVTLYILFAQDIQVYKSHKIYNLSSPGRLIVAFSKMGQLSEDDGEEQKDIQLNGLPHRAQWPVRCFIRCEVLPHTSLERTTRLMLKRTKAGVSGLAATACMPKKTIKKPKSQKHNFGSATHATLSLGTLKGVPSQGPI